MLFLLPSRFRLLALLWLLSGPQTVWAQSGCMLSLSGRLTDHESRQPLPGATIRLLDTEDVVASDASGNYHLHVCPGVYRLQVSFLGYEPETLEVRVNGAVIRDFKLHPSAVALRVALVQGTRVAEQLPQATGTITGRELQQTRGQSLGEALQKVSGVTAIQTGPSIFKPLIHGLHSNRVTILNNGVRQEGQQWGQEHGPEIDPFIASQLTVVKGAASVRYGSDAIGGVVLVQPKSLRDSAGTGAELHLLGMSNNGMGAISGMVEGNARRLPALSWRVQGTAKRAGTARAPEYVIPNSAFAEYDFSGAVGWRKATYGAEVFFSQFNTKLGILPDSHLGNQSDFDLAVGRGRPLVPQDFSYDIERPYQQVRHDLLKLSGFVRTGTAGRLTTTLAHQTDVRDEYDRYRPRNDNRARLDRPELSYTNRTTTADLVWEHKPLGNLTGSVGLSGTYQSNRYDGRPFIPFYTNKVGGIFLIERWRHKQWQLEAGLRLDRRDLETQRAIGNSGNFYVATDQFQYTTPAASLGGIFEADPHLTLSATGSLTRRAPAANERFSNGVHNGRFDIGYDVDRPSGVPPLGPETAWHTGLTANWHDNPRFNGEVSVYQTYIQNYIYQVPVLPPPLNIRGVVATFLFQQTDALYRGIDASGSYALTPQWQLAGKAAVVRARDQRLDDYLIFTPADRAELSLRHDWRPQTGSRFSQRYAQVGAYGVARQTRVPTEVLDYALPPAGYVLLGAEIGTTVQLGDLPLDVSLAGSNLLNQTYRDYLNRFRYFTAEMGRNVTLRLRVPLEFSKKPPEAQF
ncbi:TonB-dependent receptor [Hymenobacter sp. BT188]|uniref:TonB-dependent receptor n=1 Tax=Hymenobacter sp. BT188 TaxID=2763504 RepID=UPI001651827F|nr:TonB-dependent receptor [Hymenobacter sp. BT188]MBC6608626.1 TonB-dependent receptor [Hymenobacter sp. BT188]